MPVCDVLVVEMLRWGSEDDHHYVLGVFTNRDMAEFAGEVEKTWRGGKYKPRVTPFQVDPPIDKEAHDYYIGVTHDRQN